MSPTQQRVELDQDRKEELILAKQLRACRVQILPRVADNCYQLRSSVSPLPAPPSPSSPGCAVRERDVMEELSSKIQRISQVKDSRRTQPSASPNTVREKQSSPLILINGSEDLTSSPTISKQIKLPFLNQIKQLRQAEPHHPTAMFPGQAEPHHPTATFPGQAEPHHPTAMFPGQAEPHHPTAMFPGQAEPHHPTAMFPGQAEPHHPTAMFPGQAEPHHPTAMFPGQAEPHHPTAMFPGQAEPHHPTAMFPGQAEPHHPAAMFPGQGSSFEARQRIAEPASTDPHLGHLENRPKLNSFPFLDDIRKLRKDSTQTNNVEKEDCPNMRYSQHTHSEHPESINISEQAASTRESCSSNIEEPALNIKTIGGAKEKFHNDLSKFTKDALSTSPPTKSVRFSTFGADEPKAVEEDPDIVSKQGEVKEESDEGDIRNNGRAQKSKKYSKYSSVKIDEKTNVSKLADSIIPQLNNMQKNFLGLLFFNELSQNIVDDIVAQQLVMMSGSKLSSVLSSLEPQPSYTALNMLMSSCSEEGRLSVLCDNFSYLSSEEKAGVLFSTSEDVADVCTTIADYGGRKFKKSLISKLIADEDEDFLVDIHERRCLSGREGGSRLHVPDDLRNLSSAEENYNSAEESIAEDVNQYEYEYFDFDNK